MGMFSYRSSAQPASETTRVRPLTSKDWNAVSELATLATSLEDAKEILTRLQNLSDYGLVAAGRVDRLDGFVTFKVFPDRFEMTSLIVHPRHRRVGVGRSLLSGLVSRLSPYRRQRLDVVVNERDEESIAFFCSCGFVAVRLERGWFGKDDGYRMVLEPKLESAPLRS